MDEDRLGCGSKRKGNGGPSHLTLFQHLQVGHLQRRVQTTLWTGAVGAPRTGGRGSAPPRQMVSDAEQRAREADSPGSRSEANVSAVSGAHVSEQGRCPGAGFGYH